MVISNYFIAGYWLLLYYGYLMIILLKIICDYFINDYLWLFY
jgi:hypothetical protein